MTRFYRALVLTVTIVGFVASAIAGGSSSKNSKHITFKVDDVKGASAGQVVWVTITAKTDKHWHTYSSKKLENSYGLGPTPTVIKLKSKEIGKISGKIKNPKPHVEYDEGFELDIETLEGTFSWQVPILVDPTLPIGTQKGMFNISFQMCDTTSCLPPDDSDVPFTIEVRTISVAPIAPVDSDTAAESDGASANTGGSTKKTAAAAPPADTQSEIAQQQSKGLWSFFLYAMGVGFVALLTPCVFPMIPITVSFFTKRHEKSKGKGLRDSVVFGTGIVATFTAVGIVVSAIFGGTAVQDLAANPWLNLGIGLLFVVLAFNLFGAFEIQIPVSIMNALNKKSQGDGVLAVWLMGLTFALTSFTCTVPFIGTLLLSAASAQDANAYIYPAVGTLGFATAFAIPFVLLSMFPALLMRLPRAGGWMNNLKVVMGFLEIAAAIKFFSTAEFVWNMGVLPREPFLAIWAGVCFLIVLYILGVFAMKLDSPVDRVSGIRAFFAVIFASMGFYFLGGMMGKPLAADLEALLPPDNYLELIEGSVGGGMAPPTTGDSKTADAPKEVWLSNLDDAKRIAKETGKPIFIDFTGFACTNCRWMEKRMFPKSSVQQRFEKMVLVQLFTDRKEEPYITNQNLMREYGTVANPLYVILKPDGSYVGQSAYTRDEQAFLKFLDAAL